MNISKENDLIVLSGHVDSENQQEFHDELFRLATDDIVTIDIKDLKYISSAGLRVLLQLSKNIKKVNIVNASEELFSIFEMTGFTEILNIKKQIRELSLDNLKKIGEGQTGAVYRINDELIVKVFNSNVEYDIICREREMARNAFVAGIPTCISYEVVKVLDSYGIVYELVNSKTLEEIIAQNKDDNTYIKKYAELLKTVHSVDFSRFINGTPSLLTRYIGAAEMLRNKLFNDEEVEKIKQMFKDIGEADTFVHGDAHPGNIMVQGDELLFIDMTTSGCGSYILDMMAVASHFSTWRKIRPDEEYEAEFGYTKESAVVFWNKFLSYYFDKDDKVLFDELEKKLDAINAFKYILGAQHSKDERMKERIPVFVSMVKLAIN